MIGRTILMTLSLVVFAFVHHSSTVHADSPFTVYPGDIEWEKEVGFLDNFAIYLDDQPETIGYIAFFSDRKVSRKQLTRRIERSVNYLCKTRGIERERIKTEYLGVAEKSKIVLQPLDSKDVPRGIVSRK